MRADTIAQLRKISKPRQFAKDDYICHEGQPGNEMYIILKGSVGIFVTNTLGTLNQVATMKEGGFFGEMAIFDSLPRSASCIAMEDTICVAVDKSNLKEFLVTCPDIAMQMLNNMSGRVRKLNDDLYKSNRGTKEVTVSKFVIPPEYGFRHIVKEPYQDPRFLVEYEQSCPICGKRIQVKDIKRNVLQTRSVAMDGRITYMACDPLWHEVLSCPNCYYTNHYLRFFNVNVEECDIIGKLVRTEYAPVVEDKEANRSEFDILVMKYLQAIHLNETISPNANVWIGGLWRNLYWLIKDSLDEKFSNYCAKHAISKFEMAMKQNEIFDDISRGSTALSLASMLLECDETEDARAYLEIAVECPDKRIRDNAVQLQEKL